MSSFFRDVQPSEQDTENLETPESAQTDDAKHSRSSSAASGYSLSMRSDRSKDLPLHFSGGPAPSDSGCGSTVSEYPHSMRSDRSKDLPLHFSGGPAPSDSGCGSTVSEYPHSMRSDRSKDLPLHFSGGPAPSDSGCGSTSSGYPHPMRSDFEDEDPDLILTATEKKFSVYIRDSRLLDDGPPARYQLRTDRVNLDKLLDENSKLSRFTFGKSDHIYPNKTVLLVGPTGSGKSTLINALVNFVMGVKFEDKVWFEMVPDEKRETTAVSVYEVFGFAGKPVTFSLTIIDTPGYGDTRGIEYDDVITKLLQDLFCVPDGVKTIDAVGLVLKSSENRLDEKTAYIFKAVTSLFGRNMEQNIMALMTHSDGEEPENALQALKNANIKCAKDKNNEPVYFLFNNRQQNRIKAERAARFAFETFEDGMKGLTEFLRRRPPQSLKTTVEALRERTRLTACIQNLKERVETIEKQKEAIEENQDLLNNKEETSVRETHKEKEVIESKCDTKALTCKKCEENCHYPGCTGAWGPRQCEVMKDGRCTSCSGKCPVEEHVKKNWRYVTKIRPVTKKGMKSSEQMEKEKSDLEQTKHQCLDEAFQLMEKLQQIPLPLDSVSTDEHLEFLMNMEEREDTEKVRTLIKFQKTLRFQLKSNVLFREIRKRNIERQFKNISTKIHDGPPARYQLKVKRVNLDRLSDAESKLSRFTFGNRDHNYPNKTVLLVGPTGSGMSTLINALVNFVMGVRFEDKVWFEIIEEEKNKPQTVTHTTTVSVYEVFGFEGKTVPYSLTIINTPGCGDTRGIEYDDVIMKKLQDLFCVPDGVKTIDAVGLVLKSGEKRLSERTTNIFNSVTSLFGRDMEQNIVALMTHSDGGKPENALNALKEAKVKCARDEKDNPVYFTFDNRQNKLIEHDRHDRMAEYCFHLSEKGMRKFTGFLKKAVRVGKHNTNTTVKI